MATENQTTNPQVKKYEKRYRSIFELPSDFFDSSTLSHHRHRNLENPEDVDANSNPQDDVVLSTVKTLTLSSNNRWSCNTCKVEFESLLEQRSHFKSDYHRLNVKLSIAGKEILKEEDFDVLASNDLSKDNDISSISGSDDEVEGEGTSEQNDKHKELGDGARHKLFLRLKTGELVSLWECLVCGEGNSSNLEEGCCASSSEESEVMGKLKMLNQEPRDKTCLRTVLLASGGHFAGCVFDGNSVVAHKTFHRYVVRAKAGKKQSSKDASGRAIHSAGASLRRYNELALKKEIQDLLAAWKPYFDASLCIFVHAPSNNRQLLFNGEKPYFSHQLSVIQSVPLTVRRPTLKEVKRIYTQLTQITYEVDHKGHQPSAEDNSPVNDSIVSCTNTDAGKEELQDGMGTRETEDCCSVKHSDAASVSSESEPEVACASTPLHEAAFSGMAQKVLELLEQGLDPTMKDERGRTAYMLASDKEVRNTFRRFMASNLDKWDWYAAKVPSALTQEMEESQAAKKAEKDAKKKARAKELKKLRKAKEKKAQAEAALNQQKATSSAVNSGAATNAILKGRIQSSSGAKISKEEELKQAQAAEREKRAAAAERRMAAATAATPAAPTASKAAANPQAMGTTTTAPSSSQPKTGSTSDILCSCCNASLAGKIPFHRYNYKYCSTSCMHVHREALEDS
ncbi:VLRF1/Vms1 [Dillenia turbinata]|uniref:VLRF1/Vms1 n=1 Tax=Dillenia turbinata TaxID=194707 RepID=A0AAN8UQ91_9MAGN